MASNGMGNGLPLQPSWRNSALNLYGQRQRLMKRCKKQRCSGSLMPFLLNRGGFPNGQN